MLKMPATYADVSLPTYATPNPNKKHIDPAVNVSTKAGRALMGFRHTQLGQMLCPVNKYLQDYIKDPTAYVQLSLPTMSNILSTE